MNGVRGRLWTAAGTVLVSLTLVSCQTVSLALHGTPCERQEKLGYPALERVASTVLRDVEHSHVQRVSDCQSTGQPRASVIVVVKAWTRHAQAVAYFESHGWKRLHRDGYSMTSPHKDYQVNPVRELLDPGPNQIDAQFIATPAY